MYTKLSTARHALQLGTSALLLTIGSSRLLAQDPPPLTKLRAVTVTAPPLPGPNIMLGIVRDTAGIPIPGAEVIIPGLQKRLVTNAEGVVRFESIRKGKHTMRARKVGFAPQIREFQLDSAGGVAEFVLAPMIAVLQPMVVASERPGISGVVGDTAFEPIAGAFVRLMGEGDHVETDSAGRFYFPAKGGTHTLAISKVGYDPKLVSVNYPADSGRKVTVWLNDVTHLQTVLERQALDSLRMRLAWATPQKRMLWTHAQLEEFGSDFVFDAVNAASARNNVLGGYDRDCMVIVNGGPGIVNLSHLTVDEIETVEVYSTPSTPAYPVGRGRKLPLSIQNPGRAGKTISTPALTPMTARAAIENGSRICPTVYVWLR
jgi:hypothetical protein